MRAPDRSSPTPRPQVQARRPTVRYDPSNRSNAARCVSRRIQSSCTLSTTRHASRDPTMRTCTQGGVQRAAARPFRRPRSSTSTRPRPRCFHRGRSTAPPSSSPKVRPWTLMFHAALQHVSCQRLTATRCLRSWFCQPRPRSTRRGQRQSQVNFVFVSFRRTWPSFRRLYWDGRSAPASICFDMSCGISVSRLAPGWFCRGPVFS